jgi:hypothetical protein
VGQRRQFHAGSIKTLLDGDGVKDLLVADQGSNDVSILVGHLDPKTSMWSETAGSRLHSGGIGPLGGAVQNTGGPNEPNLLVSNESGKVALMRGIGSNGKASGFFRDANPPTVNLGQSIVGSIESSTGGLYVVGTDGSLNMLSGNRFTTIISQGVATLDTVETSEGQLLVAGLDNHDVEVLSATGTVLALQASDATAELSALQAMPAGAGLDVFLTQTGSEVPLVVSFPFIQTAELPPPATGAVGTTVSGAELVLVATLFTGGLLEGSAAGAAEAVPGDSVFALFVPPTSSGLANRDNHVGAEGDDRIVIAAPAPAESPNGPAWQELPLGVTEALRKRMKSPAPVKVSKMVPESLDEHSDPLEEVFPIPMVRRNAPEIDLPPSGPLNLCRTIEDVWLVPQPELPARQISLLAPPTAAKDNLGWLEWSPSAPGQATEHGDDLMGASGFAWVELLPMGATLLCLIQDDDQRTETD